MATNWTAFNITSPLATDGYVNSTEAGATGFGVSGSGTYTGTAPTNGQTVTVLLDFGGGVTQSFTATLANVTTGATKTFTWTLTDANLSSTSLTQGSHAVTVSSVTDAHGASTPGSHNSASFTYDTVADGAPSITVSDNVGTITGNLSNNGTTDDTNLTVRVSLGGTNAAAGHVVQVFDGATQVGSNYTLTATDVTNGFVDVATGSLANGTSHTYSAKLVDVAGNTSAASSSITTTIDTTAPGVSIDNVTANNIIDQSETSGFDVTGGTTGAVGQTITVELRDGVNAVIDTKQGTVQSDGTWSVHFGNENLAASGVYSISASVSDAAGNLGSGSHNFSTDSTVCFMPGTRILTPAGDVAVETLKRGDLVTTTDGRHVPVSWLGRQTLSRVFGDPLRVLPIRIKAGALGEDLPARDLLISPDHAILIDAVLVQAGALVNGTSIVRETNVPATFTLYHVEVDDHSLILAENVPSETFIDNVDRLAFDNWDEHLALYPQGKRIFEMPYPRAQSQRQVPQAIRQRLSSRAIALFGAAASSAA